MTVVINHFSTLKYLNEYLHHPQILKCTQMICVFSLYVSISSMINIVSAVSFPDIKTDCILSTCAIFVTHSANSFIHFTAYFSNFTTQYELHTIRFPILLLTCFRFPYDFLGVSSVTIANRTAKALVISIYGIRCCKFILPHDSVLLLYPPSFCARTTLLQHMITIRKNELCNALKHMGIQLVMLLRNCNVALCQQR